MSSSSSSAASPLSPADGAPCALVQLLHSQSPPTLRCLQLAQIGGSALSLGALAFGMLQLCTRQTVPLPHGTLLVVLNLCVALLLGNVGVLLSSIYHVHVPLLRAPSTHCYWLSFSLVDCLMLRTIFNVSLFSVYTAGACLALERIVGSLLLVRRRSVQRTIALFLVIFQWLLSAIAAIPPGNQQHSAAEEPPPLFPHCAALTPPPTHTRSLFFAALGMQAFVLAIYSILTYHHHCDPMVLRELARPNAAMHEQVHATEQSLPLAACVVAFFLANTLLDRSFLLAAVTLFTGVENSAEQSPRGGKTTLGEAVFRTAVWNEYQTLALPLMSILFVGVVLLQSRAQRRGMAEEDALYEQMGGSHVMAVRKAMDTDEEMYENRTSSSSESSATTERVPKQLKRTKRLNPLDVHGDEVGKEEERKRDGNVEEEEEK